MAVNVCPADRVHAPVERVWELLINPAEYGRFWDWNVERVEPEGPASVGQKIFGRGKGLGRLFRIDGEIQELDVQRHQILFHGFLSGLRSSNRIMCTRIDDHSCTVRYG